MNNLRGTVVFLCISVWTVAVCLPLYVMFAIRLLVPLKSFRHFMTGPMDSIIDAWVSFNAMLIRRFRLTNINVSMPPELNDRHSWYMVISNHQSWADILVLQDIFRSRLPVLKFFTKRELIWAPMIGLAMWCLGFPYVRRVSSTEASLDPERQEKNVLAMNKACDGFLKRPVAVLSFLEGTRFTETKKRRTQSPYGNLLIPKTGGISFVLRSLVERTQDIIDVTIVYRDDVPGFWDFLCGRCRQIDVEVVVLAQPELDHDSMRNWVHELWQAKDQRLTEIRS